MPPSPQPDPRHARRVLALVSSAAFVASLDMFIVNVAFPEIAADFDGVALSSLSWVLSAYAIVFAALLVPAGRLADLLGRRRIFVAGMTTFTAASALCALAGSVEVLVAARVLQAAGAAMLVPAALGLLLPEFPPERRAGAVAIFVAAGTSAAGLGPTIGGLLVEADWRWVFLVNLPVGIATVAVSFRVLRESRDPSGLRPDLLGAALLAAGIAALALAIVEGPEWGWGDARTLGAFAAAAALLALVVPRSAGHPAPVLEMEVLRVRTFAVATAGLALFSVAFAAFLLGIVLFLDDVWGMSTLEAGLAITPGPLTATLLAPWSARLVRRVGARALAIPGGIAFGLGTLSMALLLGSERAYATEVLPGMLLTGIGVGLTLPTLSGAGAAALPPARFATGNAVLTMARQMGFVLGVALVTAIHEGAAGGGDLLGAYEATFAAATGLAVASGLAVTALRRPAPAPETAAVVTGDAAAARA